MKRWLTSSILFVVVLGAVPAMVSAQEFRNMEFNPYLLVSAYSSPDFTIGFPQTITPVTGELKFDTAAGGGFRWNINTTRHWGEEVFFSYQANTATFARTGTVTSEQSFDIRVWNWGGNVVYYFSEDEDAQGLRPFLTTGLGGTVYQPTAEAKQAARDPLRGNLPGFGTSNLFAYNYGGGLKLGINHTFGLRLDVRGFLGATPSFGLPRNSINPSAVVFPASGAFNNGEASVGFFIRAR
jgi:hypothetical protein